MIVMTKVKDIFEEKINKNKLLHDELVQKEINDLNKKLKSEKYKIENMITNTGLGVAYHDLIDSKDMLNSDLQRNFNKTYHSIDVELYKLNKMIDRKSKMVNYKYNNKKEKVFSQIRRNIM